MGDLGRLLMLVGIAFLVVGALVWSGVRIPWLGRLPGDFSVERENFRFYFPLVSRLLISIVLSLLLAIARRWW